MRKSGASVVGEDRGSTESSQNESTKPLLAHHEAGKSAVPVKGGVTLRKKLRHISEGQLELPLIEVTNDFELGRISLVNGDIKQIKVRIGALSSTLVYLEDFTEVITFHGYLDNAKFFVLTLSNPPAGAVKTLAKVRFRIHKNLVEAENHPDRADFDFALIIRTN